MQSLIEAFRRSGNASQVHHCRWINTIARVGPNGFPVHRGLQLINPYSTRRMSKMYSVKDETEEGGLAEDSAPLPPPPPPPPRFNFPVWARWVLGSVLTFIIPIWKQKWTQIRRIEAEAEMVVEGVEIAAEAVEKVATAVEKESADVAAKLPDDSKWKEAASLVERFSEEAAKDARLMGDVLHKVEALKDDATNLEKFVEPIVHKITEKGREEGTKSKL